MAVVPVARSLFVCDLVIVDEESKNVTLVNIHNRFLVDTFPSGTRKFAIFGILVNSEGIVPIELVITHLDTSDRIYQGTRSYMFPNRLQEIRFHARMTRIEFREEGVYEIVLAVNGEMFATTPFSVHQRSL